MLLNDRLKPAVSDVEMWCDAWLWDPCMIKADCWHPGSTTMPFVNNNVSCGHVFLGSECGHVWAACGICEIQSRGVWWSDRCQGILTAREIGLIAISDFESVSQVMLSLKCFEMGPASRDSFCKRWGGCYFDALGVRRPKVCSSHWAGIVSVSWLGSYASVASWKRQKHLKPASPIRRRFLLGILEIWNDAYSNRLICIRSCCLFSISFCKIVTTSFPCADILI